MYDKELVLDSLGNVEDALRMIIERASVVTTPDDFFNVPGWNDAIGCNLYEFNRVRRGCKKD